MNIIRADEERIEISIPLLEAFDKEIFPKNCEEKKFIFNDHSIFHLIIKFFKNLAQSIGIQSILYKILELVFLFIYKVPYINRLGEGFRQGVSGGGFEQRLLA